MRPGAKSHARIEHEHDGIGVRCFVPRRNNPQALRNTDRVELRLRQLHPVLLGDFLQRERRNVLETNRFGAGGEQLVRIGSDIEQRDDSRAFPARRGDRTGLAELRRLTVGAGVGVFNTGRERAGFEQGVG